MFIDACALIALLSGEEEAQRVSDAIESADVRFTSPVAVLETAIGLARPDKFDIAVDAAEKIVVDFLEARDIDLRDLPPAPDTSSLSASAATRFRSGRHRLNLGDCLHYACAKYHDAPILATADEFRQTDLAVMP